METSFTPIAALVGGIIIGSASVLWLLTNGRIAGISSVMGGLISLRPKVARWERAAFIAGMVIGPLCVAAVAGWPDQTLVAGGGVMIVAGFLVGFGTITGSGCTSGHGVCGIGRLAPRSIAATLAFMMTAFGTVAIVDALGGTLP